MRTQGAVFGRVVTASIWPARGMAEWWMRRDALRQPDGRASAAP